MYCCCFRRTYAAKINLLLGLRGSQYIAQTSMHVWVRILSNKNANTSVSFTPDGWMDVLFDICCSGVTNSHSSFCFCVCLLLRRPSSIFINFSINFVCLTEWLPGWLAGWLAMRQTTREENEILCSFTKYFVLDFGVVSHQHTRVQFLFTICRRDGSDAYVWLPFRTSIFFLHVQIIYIFFSLNIK